MIKDIENWVDETLNSYSNEKRSCAQFYEEFKGFYPLEFLQNSYFVIVDELPKPDFPSLREAGLGGFIDERHEGITYKNTYFIELPYIEKLSLHFHELVHVLQWGFLGTSGFIGRYIYEINKYGYEKVPLEKMAYGLDKNYSNKGELIDIPWYVKQNLKKGNVVTN